MISARLFCLFLFALCQAHSDLTSLLTQHVPNLRSLSLEAAVAFGLQLDLNIIHKTYCIVLNSSMQGSLVFKKNIYQDLFMSLIPGYVSYS